ncbi:hypothetical protein [Bosea sp. PAMC 26642]|uniref:hypothetical protein n=1 Tax=Bosea sp. (strain PAMC 26642) TaxID=1792307 RepID=UPI0007700032|nr:hypothetical protein [Bosea sp. PAMC 26642]AMJ61974.1 hypothetical protein AXW83_18210 [Bosea sp. PAMC 26642]
MGDVLQFPKTSARTAKADGVCVVHYRGRWSAATYAGTQLLKRFPARPNAFEAAVELMKDMASRQGLCLRGQIERAPL